MQQKARPSWHASYGTATDIRLETGSKEKEFTLKSLTQISNQKESHQTHHSTMKIKIEFDTDNAAFADHPNAHGLILRELALLIEENQSGPIRDINGNTIGAWSWD